MASVPKTVLITGCSEGGIGAAIASCYQQRGYHVFATARSLSKMAGLSSLPNVTCLELDVTSQSSIDNAVATVRETAGGRLDGLVNNAGAAIMGPAIDTDMLRARRLFDVNYWGMVAMTKAFAEMLIAAQGAVVNIGSISGVLNAPFTSMYAASKSATLTYSETLRLEFAPFKVKVLTVVAGVVKSHIGDNTHVSIPQESLYRDAKEVLDERVKNAGASVQVTAERFAEQLVHAVELGQSGQIWIGGSAGTVKMMRNLLPASILDRLVSQRTGLEKVKKD